jgi:hypothetical protein
MWEKQFIYFSKEEENLLKGLKSRSLSTHVYQRQYLSRNFQHLLGQDIYVTHKSTSLSS